MANLVALLTPLPMIRSPTVVIGDKALKPAEAVVAPVPPLATARVPARVMVPLAVTGPPDVVRPVVPPLTATLVTVPEPDSGVHTTSVSPPLTTSALPALPV